MSVPQMRHHCFLNLDRLQQPKLKYQQVQSALAYFARDSLKKLYDRKSGTEMRHHGFLNLAELAQCRIPASAKRSSLFFPETHK